MNDNSINKINSEFYYKKMIDNLTEMNIEYQIEIYSLLAVVIKMISSSEVTEQDEISAGIIVERIMKNHDLKSVKDLVKKRQISVDSMKARTLLGMPSLGGIH